MYYLHDNFRFPSTISRERKLVDQSRLPVHPRAAAIYSTCNAAASKELHYSRVHGDDDLEPAAPRQTSFAAAAAGAI